jgi:hypothetical protein
MWAEFKWVVENFGNILLIGLCLLMLVGFLIEAIGRFIPTKSPDSVLSRIGKSMGSFGHSLVVTGGYVKTLLDLIKFPNKIKK